MEIEMEIKFKYKCKCNTNYNVLSSKTSCKAKWKQSPESGAFLVLPLPNIMKEINACIIMDRYTSDAALVPPKGIQSSVQTSPVGSIGSEDKNNKCGVCHKNFATIESLHVVCC